MEPCNHYRSEMWFWEGYHWRVEIYCLKCGEILEVRYKEPEERERHFEDD